MIILKQGKVKEKTVRFIMRHKKRKFLVTYKNGKIIKKEEIW